jgi:Caspase domain/Tetratricopeptide repeat
LCWSAPVFLLLVALSSVWACPAFAQVATSPKDRYTDTYSSSWAVVIGIDTYQRFPRLGYAVADAKAVAALLPSLGFAKENIYVLLNEDATKIRIESTLYRRLRVMGPNDRLFVYFAGHGETVAIRGGEEGYMLPADADPDALPPSAIAMDDMQRIAKRLPAKHYLFVMDACFSGFAATRASDAKGVTQEYLGAALREPVVQVITAGGKGQRSIEEQGHGLFTRYLLEGLRGHADQEGRGFITAGQLAAWLEPRVVRASKGKMTPQYARIDGEGHFVFKLPGAELRPLAADLTGTFTGLIEAKVGDKQGTMYATVTMVQKGSSLSGTWTSTGGSSGTMTGIVDGTQIRAFKVFQTAPCPLLFHGTAILETSRNAMSGSYSGRECDQTPLSATFRLSRVDSEPKLDDTALDFQDLFNIASSYSQQQRYEDALDYFHQARRLAEAKADDGARMTVLHFIGLTSHHLGRAADAVDYLEQSDRLAEKSGNLKMRFTTSLTLGLLYSLHGRLPEARGYLEKSLANAEQRGDEADQAKALRFLGLEIRRQGDRAEALRMFDRALELANRLKLPERDAMRRERDAIVGKD